MNIELSSGDAARSWLADANNEDGWQSLYERFGGGNCYLSLEFVRVWVACYSNEYELVLATSRNTSGELLAIMPLARRGDKITGAGSYHAEYQGWLCARDISTQFLSSTLDALRRIEPAFVMRLRYILAGACADAAQETAKERPTAQIRTHRRPILELDGDAIKKALRKKGNRSKLNRLAKLGDIELIRVSSPDEFDRYADDVIAAYDFRHGAANGVSPFFEDDRKRRFHQRWFERCPDQIEFSILLQNDRPIAAFFGVVVGDSIANAIVSHEPTLAAHSPSKLHIYMFAQELVGANVSALDLTPGGDAWKDRFATRHDEVFEFTCHGSLRKAQGDAIRDRLAARARDAIATLDISPDQARRALGKLQRVSAGAIARRLTKAVGETTEYRIYKMAVDERPESTREPISTLR